VRLSRRTRLAPRRCR